MISIARDLPPKRLRFAVALLAVFVAGCLDRASPLPFEPAGERAAPAPAVSGPFPVGVRTLTIVDESRQDAAGGPRRLVTEVWYPAVESSRGLPGASYDLRPLLTAEQQMEVSDLELPILETPAVRDAPPRRDRGPYPFVVFSHGQGGVRWQSTFYTVALASHGYVVAAPDHPGSTVEDALHDRLSSPLEGFDGRPADGARLIDAFTRPGGAEGLETLVDPERIGATGHSFGALTAFRLAARDPRIAAVVVQAPPSVELVWIELPREFTLDIPVMIQAGREDQTLSWDEHVVPSWERLHQPRFLVELVRGGHFTFSDLCAFDLASIAGRVGFADLTNVLEDGCGETATPAAIAQPIIRHFAIGFFNAILRKSSASLTDLDQANADRLGSGHAKIVSEP